LLLLVPGFGLPGAAVALLISTGPTIVLLLWVTLPRINVSMWDILTCVIRPIIATAAMVAVLWRLGMAWTPSGGTSVLDFGWDVAQRSGIGAVAYGLVLIGGWFVAGRPDGAERFILTSAHKVYARVFRCLPV
jgi:lipopolysaccharide exporter